MRDKVKGCDKHWLIELNGQLLGVLAEFCRLPYSVFDHEVSYGEEAVGRGA
jgi:hypothetical protein